MTIRANGRAALIIAAGLLLCASGSLYAAEGDAQGQTAEAPATVGSATDTSAEPAKATKHHSSKKSASKSHKSDRQTPKTAKKTSEDETAKPDEAKVDKQEQNDPAMPAAIANANAQWPSESPAPGTSTSNMSSHAGGVLSNMGGQTEQPATASPDASANNLQVVAADQLNDLDRAITESKPPLTLAKATIDPPAPEATASQESTSWDKTSLIGKIFIAFGGLLTMASAARMFMA